MSTIKQIEANRLNSQKSTGPRSEAGKAVSSMNALQTGIHAKSQIIPGEDEAQLRQLTTKYYQDFQPQHQGEAELVDIMISNAWELRRLRKSEAELWDWSITSDLKRDKRDYLQARAYGNSDSTSFDKVLDRCHTRIAAVERAWRSSLETFLKLRKQGIAMSGPTPVLLAPEIDETKSISGQPLPPQPLAAAPTEPRPLAPPAATPAPDSQPPIPAIVPSEELQI